MDRQQVKDELKELRVIYSNISLFRDYPDKINLVNKYSNAVVHAPAELILVYNYRFIKHMQNKKVFDLLDLSHSQYNIFLNKLIDYFCKVL